jgi:hypothetical protein
MPQTANVEYLVWSYGGGANHHHKFITYKDALAFVRDMGYDNWTIHREEVISVLVASSEEENEH